MIFDGRSYSALIISSSDKFTSSVAPLFPETSYTKVEYAGSIAEARRKIASRTYDFVIINSPLSDEFGTRIAIDLAHSKTTVPLLVVKSDQYNEIYAKVVEQGVFTLSKPTSSAMISEVIRLMTATRERLRGLDAKSATLEEKMEEIRIVNKAKWLLIDKAQMSENDAHKYIEKEAMNSSVSKADVARGIIEQYA